MKENEKDQKVAAKRSANYLLCQWYIICIVFKVYGERGNMLSTWLDFSSIVTYVFQNDFLRDNNNSSIPDYKI